MKTNIIYCGDCTTTMSNAIDDNSIDLTVTSPPYDNLRDYRGYTFNYKLIARELLRVTKQGGVVVWVVGDQTVNGCETLTSFKHAMFFKRIGFNVETMIYAKPEVAFPESTRYNNSFEYMFVMSKGKTKTFNPIWDKRKTCLSQGNIISLRQKDGSLKKKKRTKNSNLFAKRGNVWEYNSGYMKSSKDKEAYEHPAIFPEKMARDHIISWSNENDIILDPFCGSGTTLIQALLANRRYIGIDISREYCDLSERRIDKASSQLKLF